MFNPRPRLQVLPIDAANNCYVIDDALLEPERLLEFASGNLSRFVMAPENAFPGIELRMPDEFSARLDGFFRLYARLGLGARRTQYVYSRLSMVTLAPEELQPQQMVCHRDQLQFAPNQMVAASLLYLFKDESMGGTSFYRARKSPQELSGMLSDAATLDAVSFTARYGLARDYMTHSNQYYERLLTVPAKWNRMIFYDGSLLHTGQIDFPRKLTAEPSTGRLTLNGFFTCGKQTT